MNDLASRLRHFDRSLAELRRLNALLAGVPDEMRALDDEHTAARTALETLTASAEAATVARLAADGAVADAQERLKKFQQQVARVRNQREYGAILSEIDQAKTQLRALEEAALGALERAEATARELETSRAGYAELAARYDAELARWENEKPAVAERARGLAAEVERLKSGLPKAVVTQFLRVTERSPGGAMAPIRRAERPGGPVIWHCAACNYQIRPQVALEIRTRGAIQQCDSCRRFLYAEGEGEG
jgi:predicted  nucleic acid-binding Zn-ribbon protein